MKILWTRAARADLDRIFDYILRDNPQTALQVLDRIEHSSIHLAAHPGIGRPGRIDSTRELIVPGLPYVLPYLVGPDAITILRVVHTAMQ